MFKNFVAIILLCRVALGKQSSATVATTTTSSTASLAVSSPTSTGLNQIARFDNDPETAPVVGAEPVNIYLDLFWQGFALLTIGLGSTTSDASGVTPNSPPNVIGYAPTLVATITQGQPEMTTVYDNSTITEFDLYSFFFGCALDTQNTVVDAAQACTVTVTGLNVSGEQVAEQSFSFEPTGVAAQMVEAVLGVGFRGLQSALFNTTSADGVLISTVVDTVNYTVYG